VPLYQDSIEKEMEYIVDHAEARFAVVEDQEQVDKLLHVRQQCPGLEYVIFRPSFVFGREGGALGQFKKIAKLAPVTPIVGPGTQRLQPIWVEDLAEYYARALDLPAAANRTFEIGGPDAPTWNEFWDRLKRVLGVRRPSVHIPFGVMRIQAALIEKLPGAPVTRDQLKMLQLGDNTVTDHAASETFEQPLVPLDEQLRRAAP